MASQSARCHRFPLRSLQPWHGHQLWCVLPIPRAIPAVARVSTAAADISTEEKDLIIIGGGVAGYVAAIKAGQEGLKVWKHR